jgi:N-methylhydantoinase B/oxoprolinase/acetone carboxylase alpha subunit
VSTPGGGGFGDPAERDAAAMAKERRDGLTRLSEDED